MVTTGAAVVALDFAIERLNPLLAMTAAGVAPEAPVRGQVRRLSGALERYAGFALICGGVVSILLARLTF